MLTDDGHTSTSTIISIITIVGTIDPTKNFTDVLLLDIFGYIILGYAIAR